MPRFKSTPATSGMDRTLADALRRGPQVAQHMADRLEAGESVRVTGRNLAAWLGARYAAHGPHVRCLLLPDGQVQECTFKTRILQDR